MLQGRPPTTCRTYVGGGHPRQLGNSSEHNEKMPMARRLLTMLTVQGGGAVFQADNKEVDVMLEERKTRRTTDPVHLGLNEQRKPLLRGEAYHYLIALGDQR